MDFNKGPKSRTPVKLKYLLCLACNMFENSNPSRSASLYSGNVWVPAFTRHCHGGASEIRFGLKTLMLRGLDFQILLKQGVASKALMLSGLDFKNLRAPNPEPKLSPITCFA